MAKYTGGADALDALEQEQGSEMEFYSLKSGNSVKVRALGLRDLIRFRSYGIFKTKSGGRINSFVAENPSTYNDKGFPKSDLTPWDKAFDHFSKLAFDEENDKVKKELREQGRDFLGKDRFALGFIDLSTGMPIIIDFSKNQARAVHSVIKKNEKKLDKKAFEIEKTGKGKDTVVLASPLDLDDLTEKEAKNFAKFDGEEFDMNLFEGLLYVADEKEQVELLTEAGFDISLIGYTAEEPDSAENEGKDGEPEEEYDF